MSAPRGFLWCVGEIPGYAQLVKASGKVLVLRRRKGGDFVVEAE